MKGNGSANFEEFSGELWRFRLYANDERRDGQRLYRLDPAIGEVPIRLGNPGLHLLDKLLDQREEPVSKKDLKHAAWGARAEGEGWDDNLRVEINKLRTSLGERARKSCIQTRREGYAYVEPENNKARLARVDRVRAVEIAGNSAPAARWPIHSWWLGAAAAGSFIGLAILAAVIALLLPPALRKTTISDTLPTPAALTPLDSDEMSMWAKIKSSEKIDELSSYLDRFPNSRYSEYVRHRLNALRAYPEISPLRTDSLPLVSKIYWRQSADDAIMDAP